MNTGHRLHLGWAHVQCRSILCHLTWEPYVTRHVKQAASVEQQSTQWRRKYLFVDWLLLEACRLLHPVCIRLKTNVRTKTMLRYVARFCALPYVVFVKQTPQTHRCHSRTIWPFPSHVFLNLYPILFKNNSSSMHCTYQRLATGD